MHRLWSGGLTTSRKEYMNKPSRKPPKARNQCVSVWRFKASTLLCMSCIIMSQVRKHSRYFSICLIRLLSMIVRTHSMSNVALAVATKAENPIQRNVPIVICGVPPSALRFPCQGSTLPFPSPRWPCRGRPCPPRASFRF